jgi:DNA-binding Lrp family transcriptional regulator
MQPGGLIMDETDMKLLSALQIGFPVTSRPFMDLAHDLELSETEVMSRLDRLHNAGFIRRIGPILDLQKLGMRGVLVALKAPIAKADDIASLVNNYAEVSHNYLRPNESGYNMWFTVSAPEDRVDEILREIGKTTGCKLLVLPTKRIFKIGVKFDII